MPRPSPSTCAASNTGLAFARMTRLCPAPPFTAVSSPCGIGRTGPIQLDMLVDYNLIRQGGSLTRWAQESISRQIPCSGRKGGINSLLAQKIPSSTAQGIFSQIAELAHVFETDFRKKRLIRRNSLHFSLPPGNSAHRDIVELIRGAPPKIRLVGTSHAGKTRIKR